MIEDEMNAKTHQEMGEETQQFLTALFRRDGGSVYERLKACAYQRAGARAHKVDPSLAALEAIVQAALRRSEFRGTTEQEFWGWLRRILINQVIEGLRRSGARALSLGQPEAHAARPSAEGDPAVAAERSDEISALYRAVERLSEDDREVFCLYHRSDIPKPVVAVMLGITEVTLRQRARQARRKLKASMEHAGDGIKMP